MKSFFVAAFITMCSVSLYAQSVEELLRSSAAGFTPALYLPAEVLQYLKDPTTKQIRSVERDEENASLCLSFTSSRAMVDVCAKAFTDSQGAPILFIATTSFAQSASTTGKGKRQISSSASGVASYEYSTRFCILRKARTWEAVTTEVIPPEAISALKIVFKLDKQRGEWSNTNTNEGKISFGFSGSTVTLNAVTGGIKTMRARPPLTTLLWNGDRFVVNEPSASPQIR